MDSSHLHDIKPMDGKGAKRGSIMARFRNTNILLFVVAVLIMSAMMALLFLDVHETMSQNNAKQYAVSAAEALSAHINKEISLLSKAAKSAAVVNWMNDEENNTLKMLAYAEMSGIVGELYSYNLYVGLAGSLHEYKVDEEYGVEGFFPFDVLDPDNPVDDWFFECLSSDMDYVLSVAIDHVMQRKRVWLDYKVAGADGAAVGVICTGLEFAHVAGELFAKYGDSDMRGLIVDERGYIQIDSSLLWFDEFLYNEYETPFENEITDKNAVAAMRSHLSGIDGFFTEIGEPDVMKISFGPYNYMTVTPIRDTNWSVVILSGGNPLFNIYTFLPVLVTVLALLILFAAATGAANYRMVFLPLNKLDRSLAALKDERDAEIYGLNRNDELGTLSNTIYDLFIKAHYDALTGIYNRRFMENNMQHVMEFAARGNGLMSVIMIDIDHFKKYNDAYGHDQGDKCLREVAKAIAGGVTRSSDFAARYGGEEFIAVLPNTDEAGARVVAEKILANVKKLNLEHKASGTAPHVTVSAGVATGRVGYMQKREDYIRRADEALYISKRDGRDRYSFLPLGEQ